MTWSTAELEYEGLPLLLRKPDYPDIWKRIKEFAQLVAVQHILEKVTSNGLPDKKYNATLFDFDKRMCGLFKKDTGAIFLIETFAGKRNYYYSLPGLDLKSLINDLKREYGVELKLTSTDGNDWDFLKTYPFKLYKD